MLSYRQQIETLESHLSALQQPVRHSPSEIFTLIKRLHETFIALAAQLQQVHEAMKVQFQTPHPLARVNRNNNTTQAHCGGSFQFSRNLSQWIPHPFIFSRVILSRLTWCVTQDLDSSETPVRHDQATIRSVEFIAQCLSFKIRPVMWNRYLKKIIVLVNAQLHSDDTKWNKK